MSNGYFQLICSKSGTSLKIMEPRDGGQSVYIRDIMDYLNLFGVRYNSASLNKGLQDARLAGDGYEFQINEDYLSEVRGGFRLNVSPDKMTATVRFYPPSSKGTKLSVGDFLEELSDQKVVYGVKTEEIRDFLIIWNTVRMLQWPRDCVRAKGWMRRLIIFLIQTPIRGLH